MTHTPEHTPEDQRLRERYATALMLNDRDEAAALADQIGIPASEQAAHWSVAQHADTLWEPDNFDEFAALPPGRFDARVFNQTTYWVDVLRRPHRINDPAAFNDDYLLNVLDFITMEGWRWVDQIPGLHGDVLEGVSLTTAPSAASIVVAARTNIVALIRTTPLWKALIGEANARGLDLGTHAL